MELLEGFDYFVEYVDVCELYLCVWYLHTHPPYPDILPVRFSSFHSNSSLRTTRER